MIRNYRRNFSEFYRRKKFLIFNIESPELNILKNSTIKRPLLHRRAAACSRAIFKGRLLMSFHYPSRGSGNTAGRLCSVFHPFSVLSPRLFYLCSVSTFRDFPSVAYRQVREYPLDVETIRFLLCTGCPEVSQISNTASKLLYSTNFLNIII